MAKTTAPALSFEAKGQIAKTMVYSRWRGVPYVRRHVVPANPNTLAQQSVRKTFALLREMYKLAGPLLRATWDSFAQGRPFTGMNKFVGENVRVLNGEANMQLFIGSPGSKGGLAPLAMAVTSPVAGEINVVFTLPALPDGWTANGAVAVAFKDQDPAGFFTGGLVEGQDAAAPFDTVNLTGLETGESYVVIGYLRQMKPDGSLAYSVSLSDTITVS